MLGYFDATWNTHQWQTYVPGWTQNPWLAGKEKP